ncbi:MAG TPA: TIGR03790 family protein [Opitutaceae bacterium]|nr:TIGR03790 family protein [Opitutaceae bacterium]
MKILARVFVGVLLGAGSLAAQPLRPASPAAARVIILANSADPDSLRLAAHYAAARGVPAENLVALRMPLAETVSWPEFISNIWQPLQDELVRRGWIGAIDTKMRDEIGRKKYAMISHRLAYLVVCRGVPLRIAADKDVAEKPTPFSSQPQFQTNQAAVDSELSLLAQSTHAVNGWLPNPLFRTDYPTPFELSAIVKVGRLDGPTLADAENLVDNALIAERTGLLGRSYIDESGKNPEGDRWLEAAAAQLAALGFDGDVDRAPATLPITARCDAPAIYVGWYVADLNGPFRLPNFTFPPGAIALHIHSFSAQTLRSATQGWCGPLVARGVTATMGNVYEPYLELTHHPDLLLHALARGWTLGDAAYYALPSLSWQAVLIGDPLYRPFAVNFEHQWKNLKSLPPALAPYAVLRHMRLLGARGESKEATAAGRAIMDDSPSLVLGLALAERSARTGDAKGAAREIEFVRLLKEFRPQEWALAAEAAQLLAAGEKAPAAVEVWKNLLASPAMPAAARAVWLTAARDTALAAHDSSQAAAWEEQLAELKPEGE